MGLGWKTKGRDRKEAGPPSSGAGLSALLELPLWAESVISVGRQISFSLLIKTRRFNICCMVTFLRSDRTFWSSCFGLHLVSWKSIVGDLRPLESNQGVSDPRIRTLFCVTLKMSLRASFWLILLHIPLYCSINIHHSPDVRLYYVEMGI